MTRWSAEPPRVYVGAEPATSTLRIGAWGFALGVFAAWLFLPREAS